MIGKVHKTIDHSRAPGNVFWMTAFAYVRWLLPFSAAPTGSGESGTIGRGRQGRLALVRDVSVSTEGEIALLERLRDGDEGALLEIVRVHTELLTRYARVLVGGNELADDVVQDVFVSLWEQREAVKLRSHLRPYLLGAVRHRSLNVLRTERAKARTATAFQRDGARILASVNDAPDRLATDEINGIVDRALGGLAPQCRTIFLLSWRAGLTHAEIAQELEISIRTVYNQMYRATSHLAETLRDRWERK